VSRTKIEWVKNPDGSPGYTLNPITGCRNHVDGLCKAGDFPCYAYRLAHGRMREIYLGGNCVPMPYDYNSQVILDPFWPRFWPERLKGLSQDWRTLAGVQRVKQRGIFLCDMAELFGPWVPGEWQQQIFECIRSNLQHRFYLLTKQPAQIERWSPFPPNCWVGVTVTNQAQLEAAYALAHVSASVRFLSIEPMLGPINFNGLTVNVPWAGGSDAGGRDYTRFLDCLDWLIIGAQTRPYKPPTLQAVQGIVEAADTAGIPVFLKNNLFIDHSLSELEFRQEMPSDHSLENVRKEEK